MGITPSNSLGRPNLGQFGSYNVILRYQSVGSGYHHDIPPVRFRQDVEYLSEKYEIVDLSAAVASPTPGKKIALTFDHGYHDFYEHVVPVLHEFDVPATVFVISNAVLEEGFTHDDSYAYDYMSSSQLNELVDDDLVTIGNHTRTHPDLTTLADVDELESEIAGAKRDLERELSTRITRFSYPYGKHNPDVVDIVSRSHEYAVTGFEPDVLSLQNANPCTLPRIDGAVDRERLEYEVTDRGMILRNVKVRGEQFVRTLASVRS